MICVFFLFSESLSTYKLEAGTKHVCHDSAVVSDLKKRRDSAVVQLSAFLQSVNSINEIHSVHLQCFVISTSGLSFYYVFNAMKQ